MKKVKAGKSKKSKKEVKVEGEKSKPRLDKYARGGGVKKPHKTQVNVIIGSQKPPMAAPPMGAPMMPPPAPGMKTGGKVKQTHGAGGGLGRLDKADNAKNIK